MHGWKWRENYNSPEDVHISSAYSLVSQTVTSTTACSFIRLIYVAAFENAFKVVAVLSWAQRLPKHWMNDRRTPVAYWEFKPSQYKLSRIPHALWPIYNSLCGIYMCILEETHHLIHDQCIKLAVLLEAGRGPELVGSGTLPFNNSVWVRSHYWIQITLRLVDADMYDWQLAEKVFIISKVLKAITAINCCCDISLRPPTV